MTQVQVDYQKLVETKRHNLAQEKLAEGELLEKQAGTKLKEREVLLSEDFQPWKRMESAMDTVQKGSKGWANIMGVVSKLFA